SRPGVQAQLPIANVYAGRGIRIMANTMKSKYSSSSSSDSSDAGVANRERGVWPVPEPCVPSDKEDHADDEDGFDGTRQIITPVFINGVAHYFPKVGEPGYAPSGIIIPID